MTQTPLDDLSIHTLRFLLERTDFREPYYGFGFATQIQHELQKALERKRHQKHQQVKDHIRERHAAG